MRVFTVAGKQTGEETVYGVFDRNQFLGHRKNNFDVECIQQYVDSERAQYFANLLFHIPIFSRF